MEQKFKEDISMLSYVLKPRSDLYPWLSWIEAYTLERGCALYVHCFNSQVGEASAMLKNPGTQGIPSALKNML